MIDSYFHLPNPKKIKLDRLDKYTRHMPDKIFIGAKDGTLPPGADPKKMPPMLVGTTTVPLRPDQMEIFELIKDTSSSLLEARTGAGKTVIACALCQYWGTSTLIVVHSRDMIRQFGDEIKKFLGITVGEYYSSKKKLDKITITTTKSFVKHFDVFQEYGFVNLIRDEADLEFTEKQREVLVKSSAIRKLGMTGTIKTEFDDYIQGSPALCRFYGIHVQMKTSDETPLREVLYHVYAKRYEDENKIPYNPRSDWIGFRKHMDEDMDRKKEMIKFIIDNASKDDHTLVLFDRVWDVEAFDVWFKSGKPDWNVNMIHGSVPKKDRDSRIDSFREHGGVLFAQEKVAGRGFNVVKINKCFILFPCKSETNMRQIIGRAIRPFLDKDSYIYTWTDSALYFQQKQREKIIKDYFPGVSITMSQ